MSILRYKDHVVGGNLGNTYSLEEVPIGTWIDGKTLYRKVFQGTSGHQTNEWTTIGILPLGTHACLFQGFLLDRANHYVSIPYSPASTTTSLSMAILTREDGLYVSVCTLVDGITIQDRPVWIVVEYTKDSDEAVSA